MKSELEGNIIEIREVEDTIRASKKYTKGAFSRAVEHPIQGADFPSKVLTEYYEVYPDTEVHWDMPAGVAIDWLWGDVLHIDVVFSYDYRANKAKMTVRGGKGVLRELTRGIPALMPVIGRLSTREVVAAGVSPEFKVSNARH